MVTFQPARNSDQEHETPLGPDPTTMAFGVGSLTMSSGSPRDSCGNFIILAFDQGLLCTSRIFMRSTYSPVKSRIDY